MKGEHRSVSPLEGAVSNESRNEQSEDMAKSSNAVNFKFSPKKIQRDYSVSIISMQKIA